MTLAWRLLPSSRFFNALSTMVVAILARMCHRPAANQAAQMSASQAPKSHSTRTPNIGPSLACPQESSKMVMRQCCLYNGIHITSCEQARSTRGRTKTQVLAGSLLLEGNGRAFGRDAGSGACSAMRTVSHSLAMNKYLQRSAFGEQVKRAPVQNDPEGMVRGSKILMLGQRSRNQVRKVTRSRRFLHCWLAGHEQRHFHPLNATGTKHERGGVHFPDCSP